jgi:ribosome biogenesis SPOUT family RNA methylase Rps3
MEHGSVPSASVVGRPDAFRARTRLAPGSDLLQVMGGILGDCIMRDRY